MTEAELPKTWEWANVEDVGTVISGGTPKTSDPANFDGKIPWITPADLTGYSDMRISRGKRNISDQGFESSSARIIPKGSVLFSSRAPIGYVAIAANDLTTNQGFKNVALHKGLSSEYVYYYLKGAKALAESKASGTTFKEISGSRFAKFPIPVAPANEQHRIVEKIETLFARIDKGEEALREVQKLLKRYRQSILKAAVTGELTRDWREANKHKLEPASDLLVRILQNRRENWQGQGKYKSAPAPDVAKLPMVPEGWAWTTVGALITDGPQNGLYLPRSKYGKGVPILRIDDFQVGWVRPRSDLRLVQADDSEIQKYSLGEGDFVVNRVNSVSHLGKSALISEEHSGVLFESNMMRFSVSDEILKEYLKLYLMGEIGRKELIKNCKHAVNQASINQGDISSTPVPLPPLPEQEAIAREVALALSHVSATQRVCQSELARSNALRQSILKSAFTGQLVPQDPDDEPASELLTRIRAEREEVTKKRSKKKASRKKTRAKA